MKYICILFLFLSFWIYQVSAVQSEDNSIITELEKNQTQQLEVDYSMKSFDSCDAFEDVMEDYIKLYWENNYKNGYNYRGWWIPEVQFMEMESMSDSVAPTEPTSNQAKSTAWWAETDFSKTNTQVLWVDESDIVKTDGVYHYYYNEDKKAVFIVSTDSELEIIKKINLPKNFYNTQLYVSQGRLVILASWYANTDYSTSWYFINRNSKTYTIVFDTTNTEKPELLKLYSSDGDVSQTRRIGDYVYVISRNYINFPYWNYKNVDDIELNAEKMIPRGIDIFKTSDSENQNLVIQDKNLPYNVNTWKVTGCESISYNFPDEETLKNTNFNPGYTIVSAINIQDTEKKVETSVVAGSNSEVYMSNENLYMTESIWQTDNFSCPPNARCAMPFFWWGSQNTLVHKLSIDNQVIEYRDSAIVPGAPLNQYSMDEHEWDFRIITSTWSPERSTWLYVLDEDLENISSLTNLAPWETFQSSRFMWDKLFLVTFEQIDPLFAIDLTNREQPVVLWELKIPGFSTYLHPYDENHLIGLGYDTQINQWWGTQTAGVKVDLYKINYDKKCWDNDLTATQEEKCKSGDYKWIIVEQKYTKTLWGKWSYSEALNNPRMFVWNKDRNILLLPVSLYEKDDQWRTKDYFGGLYSIKIDASTWIQASDKTSHIDTSWAEEKRVEECSKYTGNDKQPVCRELLDGTMYCEDESEARGYVPNYCFKDSTVLQYIWDRSWEYRNMQIKRALYIGENVYSFSDSMIRTHDMRLFFVKTLFYSIITRMIQTIIISIFAILLLLLPLVFWMYIFLSLSSYTYFGVNFYFFCPL